MKKKPRKKKIVSPPVETGWTCAEISAIKTYVILWLVISLLIMWSGGE